MALLVIIALLGVSSATLDFFLDADESRDLGREDLVERILKFS